MMRFCEFVGVYFLVLMAAWGAYQFVYWTWQAVKFAAENF